MTIFANKIVQWIIVIVVVSFIRAIISDLLNVPLRPAIDILKLFSARNWAGTIYLMIYDLGELVTGAYLLRAFGFIEFVKG